MSITTLKVELPAEIFDVQTNVPLIHQVVVGQLAAARQGTHSTKTRAEVRGGGRKPYKQKGTGRARQGSTRAPQFAGGGIVHGPQPRDYTQRTPKKMKAAALRGALSDRARHDRIHVVESIATGDAPSAKAAAALLAGLSERKNVLVVLDRTDLVSMKSVRNLADVHVLAVDQLNTYDVLCADDILFTRAAYETFTGLEVAVEAKAEKPAKADKADADKAEKAPKAEKAAEGRQARQGREAREGRRAGHGRPGRPSQGRRRGARGRLGPRGLHRQGQRRLRSLPRARRPVVRADRGRGVVQDRQGRREGRVHQGRKREEVGGREVSQGKNPRDILISPVVSEKSYGLLDEGKYTFIVDPRSNKTEIKIAVEQVFGVKVDSVHTMNRKGKARRTRFGIGKRKDTKRAIVTLREGSIDIFGSAGA